MDQGPLMDQWAHLMSNGRPVGCSTSSPLLGALIGSVGVFVNGPEEGSNQSLIISHAMFGWHPVHL